MEWPDAAGDKVRIVKETDPNTTIKTFTYQINEAISVRCMDLKLRVPFPHLCQNGCEMGRPERKGGSYAEEPSKLTSW